MMMKSVFLVALMVLVGGVFGQNPTPTPPPDLPDLLDCFRPVLEDPDFSGVVGAAEWLLDLGETAIRLRQQRQRCDEMPRDNAVQERAHQACMASFNATFVFESTRLLVNLNRIDPVMATRVREHAPYCFDEREPLSVKNRLRRLLSVH